MSKHEAKEIRQQQFFQSAIRLVAVQGYSKTTMEDIAKEAGLSKGNLYYHFKSKQELFLELIKYFTSKHLREMAKILFEAESSTEVLQKVFGLYNKMGAEHPEILKSFLEFHMLSLRDEKIRAILTDYMHNLISLCIKIIDYGKSIGEFKKELDSHESAIILCAATDGLKLSGLLLTKDDPFSRDEKMGLEYILKLLKVDA